MSSLVHLDSHSWHLMTCNHWLWRLAPLESARTSSSKRRLLGDQKRWKTTHHWWWIRLNKDVLSLFRELMKFDMNVEIEDVPKKFDVTATHCFPNFNCLFIFVLPTYPTQSLKPKLQLCPPAAGVRAGTCAWPAPDLCLLQQRPGALAGLTVVRQWGI